MGWLKIEDRYPRNPKVMAGGEAALALDVCGMCYCREHNTNGFVSETVLTILGPIKNPRKAAATLVETGRWERDDRLRGWWVHDYLTFNPSDEEDRAAAEERSNRARAAAHARWDAQRNAAASNGQCENGATSNAEPMPPSLPHPSITNGQPKVVPFASDFDDWWGEYPRKEKRQAALNAYQARRRQGVTAERLLSALVAYKSKLHDEGTEKRFIQHGSTFLQGAEGPWSEMESAMLDVSPALELCQLCDGRGWVEEIVGDGADGRPESKRLPCVCRGGVLVECDHQEAK